MQAKVGLIAYADRFGTDRDWLAEGEASPFSGMFLTTAEINAGLARPVVQALTRLIRFRNTHPAFDGDLTCSGDASRIVMTRACAGHEAMLEADLATGSARVTWTEDGARRQASLASLP